MLVTILENKIRIESSNGGDVTEKEGHVTVDEVLSCLVQDIGTWIPEYPEYSSEGTAYRYCVTVTDEDDNKEIFSESYDYSDDNFDIWEEIRSNYESDKDENEIYNYYFFTLKTEAEREAYIKEIADEADMDIDDVRTAVNHNPQNYYWEDGEDNEYCNKFYNLCCDIAEDINQAFDDYFEENDDTV